MLSRVAASYEANLALREELLQEICLAVWQALSRFKGDSNIKTYIMRVAHNRAVSHVSVHARRPGEEYYEDAHHQDPTPQQDQHVINEQKSALLLAAVRSLPVQQRQIFTMAMEGLSYQDIAEVSGVTVNNVGVILNRTKQALTQKVVQS
ncbi:sigma-70 family RNA polymerase sigma factor [Aestuariibacter salexigens]|uniref:RNA polymerase sigma factor n=1 Tax=Aestuariibacter salexigens TaxID=226010 RepID=UPI00042382F7